MEGMEGTAGRTALEVYFPEAFLTGTAEALRLTRYALMDAAARAEEEHPSLAPVRFPGPVWEAVSVHLKAVVGEGILFPHPVQEAVSVRLKVAAAFQRE